MGKRQWHYASHEKGATYNRYIHADYVNVGKAKVKLTL
jgi:hypothetical protein